MQDDDKTYRDTTVSVCELLAKHKVLRGLSFLDCQINGPAILYFQNCIVTDITTKYGPDHVLWELKPGRRLVGAVVADACTFENCMFHGIGIAGSPRQIKEWREAIHGE